MLRRALASVAAQSFRDCELVIVDDASREPVSIDDAVLSRIGRDRVRVIARCERGGASVARNAGLAAARGAYVAFLDDDDEWLPEKLERQVGLLDAAPDDVVLVYCGREVISDATGRVAERIVHTGSPVGFVDLLRRTVFPTSVPLLRKAAVDAIGGFDETLPGSQDRDLWLRLARTSRFALLSDVLVRTHVHGAQISSDLEAKVAAKERWVAKYRADLEGHPELLAHEFVRLGLLLSAACRSAEARRRYATALQWRPLSHGSLGHLIASFIAPRRHRDRVLRESFRPLDGIPRYW